MMFGDQKKRSQHRIPLSRVVIQRRGEADSAPAMVRELKGGHGMAWHSQIVDEMMVK